MFEVVDSEFRTSEGEIHLPQRMTSGSMAYDFYSPIDTTIYPKCAETIWTDVKVKMEATQGLILNLRSSFGKRHLMFTNTQGWIDSDYYGNESNDGNIGVSFYNYGSEPVTIKKGERIAQGMIVRFDTFGDTVDTKRAGGFGSTGI